jgi:hypothetical protein
MRRLGQKGKLLEGNTFVLAMATGPHPPNRAVSKLFRVSDLDVLAAADAALESAGLSGFLEAAGSGRHRQLAGGGAIGRLGGNSRLRCERVTLNRTAQTPVKKMSIGFDETLVMIEAA